MVLHGERRWLPPVDGVARGALPVIRARGELALVRVGLVAIGAARENQGLLKISTNVALGAIYAGVHSLQWELGLGVIKALIHRRDRDFLPP